MVPAPVMLAVASAPYCCHSPQASNRPQLDLGEELAKRDATSCRGDLEFGPGGGAAASYTVEAFP